MTGNTQQNDRNSPNEDMTVLRGSNIPSTMYHDAGAYARCSFCGRYSDHAATLAKEYWRCDCGRSTGWSGSFEQPSHNAIWSDNRLNLKGLKDD